MLGSLNFAIPVYLRTVPGQVVAAGTYQLTLNMAVTYRICTSIAIGNICLSEQNGSGVIPINITAILTNDCTTITAPNISFGSAPLVGCLPIPSDCWWCFYKFHSSADSRRSPYS